MKRDCRKLLPQTMIRNKRGEVGTLVVMKSGITGRKYWIVDWRGRGIEAESIEYIQTCDLKDGEQ